MLIFRSSAAFFIVSKPDLVKTSSFPYRSATFRMLYLLTAFRTDAGMAWDSGREFLKTYFPIWVMPTAVVDVPMIGTPLWFAIGPAAFISVLSVGPRIAATWWVLISFWAAVT